MLLKKSMMGGWRAKQRAKNGFFWKKQGFLEKNISMSYNSFNLRPRNEQTLNKTQSTKDQNILSINRKTKQGLLYDLKKLFFSTDFKNYSIHSKVVFNERIATNICKNDVLN